MAYFALAPLCISAAAGAVINAKKVIDSYRKEITDFNIEERIGVITYLLHRNDIVKASEKLQLSKNYLNIATVGHVKTGKSTLINSLRGLRATHPLGAPVGVGEVTTEAKCYDFHETLPNVKLYDFPGAGTISHPEENYFFRNGLCFLDVIIVMLQATMCVEEINLTRDAIRYNVPVIFVRSKMDSIFDDMYHDEKINDKSQETANQVLRELKEKHRRYLSEHAKDLLHVPIYHISSRSVYKIMDFINSRVYETNPEAAVSLQRLINFEERQFFEELLTRTEERLTPGGRRVSLYNDFPTTSSNETSQITDNLSLLNSYENNVGVVEENSGVVELANQGQEEELFDLENGENCCICWDSKREMAFVPCGHLVTCRLCSSLVAKCPICRKDIEKRMRIYQS